MINIRDATEADLPAIVNIYNESIPDGKSTADTKPVKVEDREAWFAEFDPARRPIWVAEEDEKILGCVYLTSFYRGRPAYNKTAEISVYLSKSAQGRGLGEGLKRKMIEACPQFGVENLISMYFDHNEATKHINRKLGFEVAGHLPEIANVFGEPRGLMIGLLRVSQFIEKQNS